MVPLILTHIGAHMGAIIYLTLYTYHTKCGVVDILNGTRGDTSLKIEI